MTRPPFDPEGLEQHDELEPVSEELERYARTERGAPPADFTTRVMSAVELEPLPRRGLGAWLAALLIGRGPRQRWAQAGVLAAALVLAVGGLIAAGELARQLQTNGNTGTSPSPTVESERPTPSVTPATEQPTPSPTPEPTPEATESEAPETPEPSEGGETAGPSASESEDEEESRTPRPSATAEPSETPEESDDHSGPD